MKKDFKEELVIPDDVDCEVVGRRLSVKKGDAEIKRIFVNPKVQIKREDKKIILFVKNGTKREKSALGTIKSHILNMIKGVSEGFEYRLKVCSSHFPMSINIEGDRVLIKNFLGEKVPSVLHIEA